MRLCIATPPNFPLADNFSQVLSFPSLKQTISTPNYLRLLHSKGAVRALLFWCRLYTFFSSLFTSLITARGMTCERRLCGSRALSVGRRYSKRTIHSKTLQVNGVTWGGKFLGWSYNLTHGSCVVNVFLVCHILCLGSTKSKLNRFWNLSLVTKINYDLSLNYVYGAHMSTQGSSNLNLTMVSDVENNCYVILLY